jgi:hypothetical protein
MYLYRREYISGWDWNDDPKEMKMYSDILEYTGAERCVGSPHAQVDICVAYWRKANAVHKWFCDLDGGRDECQSIYVTKENLIELRDLAKSVIEQPAMAGDVLPTQQGFFFGSYDYDEWYMEDMKNTVEQIDNVLSMSGEWSEFTYRASW